jgi:hypothetical protein
VAVMQAFQGYIENGRIIPVDMPRVQDGLQVIITVLDYTQTTKFERDVRHIKDDFIQDNPDIHPIVSNVSKIDGEECSANSRFKAGALTLSNFSALKLDTRNFKFDREEAHER